MAIRATRCAVEGCSRHGIGVRLFRATRVRGGENEVVDLGFLGKGTEIARVLGGRL